jgi:uncharacterized protein YndB with AHSA1/START domain
MDFRPTGIWHYCMKCIDEKQGDYFGFESWGKGVYEEIVMNEKIVYVDYFSDADANEAEGMPPSHINIIFEEHEGKTKVVSRSRFASEEALKTVIEMGMEHGIRETWDRLAEHLQAIK